MEQCQLTTPAEAFAAAAAAFSKFPAAGIAAASPSTFPSHPPGAGF